MIVGNNKSTKMIMNVPPVRPNERDFALCYVRRQLTRPQHTPSEIKGLVVHVHFGKAYKPRLSISACGENWQVIENIFFDSLRELFLVAETYFFIKQTEWIQCHPIQGEKLYSKEITKVEKEHRKLVKKILSYINSPVGSLSDYYIQRASFLGIQNTL